jgi:hypothetical protein
MKLLAACLILLNMTCAAPARSAIYAQRDAGSGAMVYSNVPLAGRSNAVRGVTGGVPASAKAAKAVLPHQASFPVIARAEQQQRDLDRQAILHDELDSEQQRLDLARAAGAAPDIQHRHRSNIAALKREIATRR